MCGESICFTDIQCRHYLSKCICFELQIVLLAYSLNDHSTSSHDHCAPNNLLEPKLLFMKFIYPVNSTIIGTSVIIYSVFGTILVIVITTVFILLLYYLLRLELLGTHALALPILWIYDNHYNIHFLSQVTTQTRMNGELLLFKCI